MQSLKGCQSLEEVQSVHWLQTKCQCCGKPPIIHGLLVLGMHARYYRVLRYQGDGHCVAMCGEVSKRCDSSKLIWNVSALQVAEPHAGLVKGSRPGHCSDAEGTRSNNEAVNDGILWQPWLHVALSSWQPIKRGCVSKTRIHNHIYSCFTFVARAMRI